MYQSQSNVVSEFEFSKFNGLKILSFIFVKHIEFIDHLDDFTLGLVFYKLPYDSPIASWVIIRSPSTLRFDFSSSVLA